MPVWIGMRRFLKEKRWVDGSPVDFLPSPGGYHSARNLNTCIYISSDWYEGTCDNNLYFICKREVDENSSHLTNQSMSGSSTIVIERWSSEHSLAVSASDTMTTASVSDGQRSAESRNNRSHADSYDKRQFEEILESLKVKRKKASTHSTKEAPGSQAIGAVAMLILLLMFTGVILLDLNTFQQNWRMFRRNVSDVRYHSQ
ncbi:uncharacterized protein LOC133191624 [Saccostrea echinata]|uniref:uncharacterized protein LOC133191624 n=1 Tax=Saccostrea echinata TaxID=191078 RepID=UPI002A7EC07C|nr:uncharacterized protein LOC133191624 [Saccostrea echinata]